MAALWTPLKTTLTQWWNGRQPRERMLLRRAAVMVAVALALQCVWVVATERGIVLRAQPTVALQAAQMDALFAEWQDLHSGEHATLAAQTPEQRRAALEHRVSQLGSGFTLDWSTQGSLRLEGLTSFEAWLRWVALAQKEMGVYVVEADMAPDPLGLRLKARLALAP